MFIVIMRRNTASLLRPTHYPYVTAITPQGNYGVRQRFVHFGATSNKFSVQINGRIFGTEAYEPKNPDLGGF